MDTTLAPDKDLTPLADDYSVDADQDSSPVDNSEHYEKASASDARTTMQEQAASIVDTTRATAGSVHASRLHQWANRFVKWNFKNLIEHFGYHLDRFKEAVDSARLEDSEQESVVAFRNAFLQAGCRALAELASRPFQPIKVSFGTYHDDFSTIDPKVTEETVDWIKNAMPTLAADLGRVVDDHVSKAMKDGDDVPGSPVVSFRRGLLWHSISKLGEMRTETYLSLVQMTTPDSVYVA